MRVAVHAIVNVENWTSTVYDCIYFSISAEKKNWKKKNEKSNTHSHQTIMGKVRDQFTFRWLHRFYVYEIEKKRKKIMDKKKERKVARILLSFFFLFERFK